MNEPRFDKPTQGRYDALYLSPHLDDAVLSCGGRIHRRTRQGESVLVVTVYAGDVPSGPLSPLEADVLRWMGLDRETGMEIRRQEDVEASRRVGAEALHGSLPEAPSRHRDLVRLEALFEPPDPDDPEVEPLAERLKALPEANVVVAPLTAGGHRDHHLVRRAAERVWGDDLLLYDDYPYIVRDDEAARQASAGGWSPQVVDLDRDDVEARIDAIRAYASQLRPLFGPPWRRWLRGQGLARKIRSDVEAAGGERVWRRAREH